MRRVFLPFCFAIGITGAALAADPVETTDNATPSNTPLPSAAATDSATPSDTPLPSAAPASSAPPPSSAPKITADSPNSTSVIGQNVPSDQALQGLDEQLQNLKKEVLAIDHELGLLEEKLLYPSSSHLSIFISIQTPKDNAPNMRLDAIQLQIDGQLIGSHIYSFDDLDSLHRGATQRIYTGNLAVGEHQLEVSVKGKRKGGDKTFEKSQNFSINKDIGPKFLELQMLAEGDFLLQTE